jgi:hypothetical protein
VSTATTSTGLDGSIGCQEEGLFAADCFGVQPDLILHMAVIDTDAGPLLVWQRDPVGAGPIDYASFEEMLASLHFPEGVTPATEPAVATTASATSDPRLPEGDYRTPELSADQLIATAVAAGFNEADAQANLDGQGIDSTATYGLRLADGHWTTLLSYDGVPFNSGWEGTYEMVDDDTVTATESGHECTITYTYAFDGAQLTLDMVDDPCFPGVLDEQIAQTVIYESAPFTLIDSGATTTAP